MNRREKKPSLLASMRPICAECKPKPCPCCNGVMERLENDVKWIHPFKEEGCILVDIILYDDKDIEDWNRRTPDLRALIMEAVELAKEIDCHCPEEEFGPCGCSCSTKYTTAEILAKLLGEK